MKIDVLKHFFYMTRFFTVAFGIQFLTMGLLLAWNGTAPVKAMEEGPVYLSPNEVREGKTFGEIEKRTNSRLSLAKREYVEVTVTGTVADAKGEPIPGVTVSVPGTTVGTATDLEGKYVLSVPEGATLAFSFIGYETQTIEVGDRSIINITLSEDMASLEEVVVVGYGSQSQKKITSSISEVNTEGLKDLPISSAGQLLEGRVSGVRINQNNGAPGTPPSIQIHGISSINAGISPLVVVDGFPVGNGIPQSLNPNDIEKITVLKDAASTSIYGARGSNGVILIQTTKAEESQSVVEYNVNGGLQHVPHHWRTKTLNAFQYARYNIERIKETNEFSNSTTPVPQIYQDVIANPEAYGEGTDWQEALIQKTPFQNHNLTFRAGNSQVSGVVSGGYLDQGGVLPNSDFSRYSLRTNLDASINKWLKVGTNVSISRTENNSIPESGARGIIMKAITASPLKSPYENNELIPYIPADSPGYFSFANPLYEAAVVQHNTIGKDMNASMNIDVKITDGLHFKPQAYGRLFTQETNGFTPSTIGIFAIGTEDNLALGAPPYVNSATNQISELSNWGMDYLLSYDKEIGAHSFSGLLGYTAQKQTGEISQINAVGFPTDNTLNYLEASEISASVSDYTNWSLAAFFGRVNYDYKAKYLAELNFRREGSSRFGQDNKYGNFPSGSVGWRVSQEDFFPKDFFINELKMRASYGMSGNSAIGDFDRFGTVISIPNLNNRDNNFNYVLNNKVIIGKSLTSLGAQDLRWETAKQLDIGLTFGFLQDQITFKADYFRKKTEDMLFSVSLPSASGFESTRVNVGEMLNEGWDFEVNATISAKDFAWNSNFNVTLLNNEVIYIPEQIDKIISRFNITQAGAPVGSLYGYVIEGIFNTQEQLDDPTLFGWTGAKKLGAYIYKDVNGDENIDALDKDIIGNPHPHVMVGFNNVFTYKNLSLSILTTGAFGYQILPEKNEVLYNEKGRWNVSTKFLNRWKSPEDPGKGLIPAIYYPGQHNASNIWVENGDHVWVKNITMSYNIPASLLGRTGFISSLRFYLSIQNALRFTKYTGWNPQVSTFGSNPQTLGVDNLSYPIARIYTLGANISF
jgi:TonB-linked SusC/RagA family outer membrane protein